MSGGEMLSRMWVVPFVTALLLEACAMTPSRPIVLVGPNVVAEDPLPPEESVIEVLEGDCAPTHEDFPAWAKASMSRAENEEEFQAVADTIAAKRRLYPYVKAGDIIVQYSDIPEGYHVDYEDALERALSCARTRGCHGVYFKRCVGRSKDSCVYYFMAVYRSGAVPSWFKGLH